MPRRYCLLLSYNGAPFCGFQVQKNGLSVQEALQDALEKLLGTRPPVKGCGRTDAGVHARRYYAMFEGDTNIPLTRLPLALSAHLPEAVAVRAAAEVGEDFHPRYSALSKEYRYTIHNSSVRDPFRIGSAWQLPGTLDFGRMQEAAALLVGTHDFAGFVSAGSSVEDTVRTITRCELWREESRVVLSVAADGFLYNMVRIIAGTLADVGLGRCTAEDVRAALQSGDRQKAGQTAPAHGLCLWDVTYRSPYDTLFNNVY